MIIYPQNIGTQVSVLDFLSGDLNLRVYHYNDSLYTEAVERQFQNGFAGLIAEYNSHGIPSRPLRAVNNYLH